MLDNATLRMQLLALERKIVGGRESIDHPKHANAHDDVGNVVAAVAVLADARQGGFTASDMALANRGSETREQQSYAARNFQKYLFSIQGIDPADPWGRGGFPWHRYPSGRFFG